VARKEGLIGRKVGMTQVFSEDGSHVPVTVIEAGPCPVIEIRTTESHGYDALQIGFGPKKKNVSKPEAGHFKKANVPPMRVVREIRLEKTEKLQGYQAGQALTVEMFTPGELVDVVGVTKGKGFQGGVRRYGWAGGDARAQRPPGRHARHQGPQRGVGWRPQAVEAEGNGPGAAGLDPRDPVEGRRQAVRSHAPRIRPGDAAHDAPRGAARCRGGQAGRRRALR